MPQARVKGHDEERAATPAHSNPVYVASSELPSISQRCGIKPPSFPPLHPSHGIQVHRVRYMCGRDACRIKVARESSLPLLNIHTPASLPWDTLAASPWKKVGVGKEPLPSSSQYRRANCVLGPTRRKSGGMARRASSALAAPKFMEMKRRCLWAPTHVGGGGGRSWQFSPFSLFATQSRPPPLVCLSAKGGGCVAWDGKVVCGREMERMRMERKKKGFFCILCPSSSSSACIQPRSSQRWATGRRGRGGATNPEKKDSLLLTPSRTSWRPPAPPPLRFSLLPSLQEVAAVVDGGEGKEIL